MSTTEARVHEYLCKGVFAGDHSSPLRCVFRIFEDGSLTAEALAQSNPQCYIYDGRALKRSFDLVAPHQQAPVFDCSFKVVRFWRNQFRTQFLVCHAQLSPSHGLVGHHVVVRADDDRPHAREVALPISITFEPIDFKCVEVLQPVQPLTPGVYELSGYTVTKTGTVYECSVVLELLVDGTLRGTSQDILFPQQCTLRGKWTDEELVYSLEYRIGAGAATTYLYTVKPGIGGLRGKWAHEDAVRATRTGENGHVELLVKDIRRRWSPSIHTKYPKVFQRVTQQLLLQSHHAAPGSPHPLPSALWQHVLSYCDFHHFKISAAMS